MVSILAVSVVDHGFKLLCVASPLLHAAFKGERADWLARNQDNVSEWGDLSIHGLLFQ